MVNTNVAPNIIATLQTSFLIPNLHCPTCVSRIEEIMGQMEPPPVVQNISIVDHIVTVLHDKSISASSISDLLGSAAYEVYDIILDEASSERLPFSKNHEGQFSHAIERWNPKLSQVDEAWRAEHERNCQSCAAYSSDGDVSEKASIVVSSSPPDTPNYQAVFSMEGMSCSSCVPNVSEALKSVPGVVKVEVALVSLSANVQFRAEEPNIVVKQLTEAVEDVGYGAELTELKPVHAAQKTKSKSPGDSWQVTYSINGMNCSSCIGKITKSVKELDFVEKVDINLVEQSGVVVFHGEDNEPLIAAAIGKSGYKATKGEMKHITENESYNFRSVSLRIDGMHCLQCPRRILVALKDLPLEIEKSPELDNPILTVSYVPKSPALTIRTILAKVEDVDKAFTVSIYHPQSVEERSRKMLARERRSIFHRVLFSVATAIPTLVIGIVYMNLVSHNDSGYMYLMEPLQGVSRAEWATFIMATPVYFYGADHFHRRTIKEIHALWRPRSPVPIIRRFYRFGSMNMLISLGTSIAYFSSLGQLITAASNPTHQMLSESSRHNYFDSVVFLTMFLLIGRLIEAQMKGKSGDAVAALGKLRSTEACLVTERGDYSSVERVNVDLVDIGDMVKVSQGSTPPCDGILLDKFADFDESSLTGESRIVEKKMGDSIYSGTINKGSAISIRITGPAGASLLDSIIQVVREGQAKRAPMERVADLLTAYFVPVVVLIAIATWIIWLALGLSGALPRSYLENDSEGWPFWSLQFAIAVFVIACPCGLGLAAPTALFVGGGLAATRGILVKGGGEAFQEASNLDAVVFDKTGTLTEGANPKIVEHRIFPGSSEFDNTTILGVLKAIEENSSHPLAKAAVDFAACHWAASIHLFSVDEIAGKGLKASFHIPNDDDLSKCEALVGNEKLLQEYSVAISPDTVDLLESWKSSGCSVILLASQVSEKWQLIAIFAAADPLRQEAKEVVRALQSQQVAVWMLSGDNPSTAKAVGAQVGIPPENIIAGVLPAQKADKVKQLQRTVEKSRGKGTLSLTNRRSKATIAFVGDGINDAPALAASDVGIAVASGSDVAVQSAAFVLVQSDLRAVLILVTLSRAVFRRVIQNFFWAIIYNMIALPIAAGVLYPIKSGGSHVRLDPAWAALAMALSSITVVGSSLLLRTRIPFVGFRGDRSLK